MGAEKAEAISQRVAASLGETMLEGHRMDQKRVPFWEVNRSDGTMAPSWRGSRPVTKGGHSTYCGAKCSLGCTSLPRLCEPTASLRRGGGEHNLPTVKKNKAALRSNVRFPIHS